MKKKMRTAALITALSLLILTLCSCSFSNKSEEITATTEPSTTPEITTEAASADITVESTSPSAATTLKETTTSKSDDIETVLDLIANYPQGTAGSSIKCVEISTRLINFTEKCTDDNNKLEKKISKYIEKLDDSQKTLFEQNLYEIDYTARKLIKGEISTLQSYLDQSSVKYNKGSYTMSKYESIYKLIAAV